MIEEIRNHLSQLNMILQTKGYDTAYARSITVERSAIKLQFCAEDDFQENLQSNQRYHSDYFSSLSADSISELYHKLKRLPSREQRELHVMIGQAATIGAKAEKLRSEAARLFTQRIVDESTDLHSLLEKFND